MSGATFFTVYSVVLWIAVVICLTLFILIWKKQQGRQAKILILALAFQIEWTITIALENTLVDIHQKIFFAKLGYLGVYGCVPFFLLFTIYFIGKDQWITKKKIIALFAVPIVMIFLAWTNDYHQLIWSGFELDPNPANNLLLYERGPLYWLGVIYNYSQFACIMIFALTQIIITKGIFRTQTITLLAGAIIVVFANLSYIFTTGPLRVIDLTALGFVLMDILIFMGIINQRLFRLIPISKEAILDGIQDGIVMLDGQNIIVDCNPAAEKFFLGKRGDMIGKGIESALKPYPELLHSLQEGKEFNLDLWLNDPPQRAIYAEGRDIIGTNRQVFGKMLIFHDITDRKRMEAKEIEQRLIAEALRDVMVALTSTLKFDEVLDRIMDNINKVMPYGMTDLQLIDENGVGRVVRSSNPGDDKQQKQVKDVLLDVNTIPHLRRMIETGEPVIIADIHQVDYWPEQDENVRSYLGAPIQIKGHTLGFINQVHKEFDYYTFEQAERLQTFADLAAIALENARLFSLTRDMAMVDELTGLNNRRNFFRMASNEVIRSIRFEKTCCLIIFDIDQFKTINDVYGHPAGDKVLKEIAGMIVEHIREIDLSGRYGGDEFWILLPETDLNGARITALRLLDAFHDHPLTSAGIGQNLSASFGIAELDKEIKSLDELIARADHALYCAKQNGRDRVEVWQPGAHGGGQYDQSTLR